MTWNPKGEGAEGGQLRSLSEASSYGNWVTSVLTKLVSIGQSPRHQP